MVRAPAGPPIDEGCSMMGPSAFTAVQPCRIYASTPSPCFWTTANNLSAMPLGCLLPDSHFWTVDSLVLRYLAKTGWLTCACSRIILICVGARVDGTARQDSSNWRIVVWSMAPTFCNAAAEAWIAAKASLLNFCFVVMANLHKVSINKQLPNLMLNQPRITVGQQSKSK